MHLQKQNVFKISKHFPAQDFNSALMCVKFWLFLVVYLAFATIGTQENTTICSLQPFSTVCNSWHARKYNHLHFATYFNSLQQLVHKKIQPFALCNLFQQFAQFAVNMQPLATICTHWQQPHATLSDIIYSNYELWLADAVVAAAAARIAGIKNTAPPFPTAGSRTIAPPPHPAAPSSGWYLVVLLRYRYYTTSHPEEKISPKMTQKAFSHLDRSAGSSTWQQRQSTSSSIFM